MATETNDPYELPFPTDDDLADVPKDIKALANQTTAGLNRKLEENDFTVSGSTVKGVRTLFQTKVKVVTSIPTSTANYLEYDVVFVIAP